jgi:tape measure domain-containing protein
MHRAMNIVINSFETMQSTSGNAVDTSAIQEAREQLARAETAFDGIEQSIRDADNQQQRFNDHIRGGTSAADGLWRKLKGVAATVGGIAGIKKVLNISDDLTQTNSRLNNALIQFDDGGSVAELEKKIMASAQRSRSYYMDTAAAVAKLGNNAKDSFTGMDEVIAFSELVNKSFVLGGASAQEQSAAMLQLTQAMASGVLRGEELNAIFEQAPNIVQNIADYLDVPIGKIRTMAADGQITADIVKNAMFAAADDIETKFENMPKTWGQIWTSMQNKALSIFAPILNKINEIGNSAKFQTVTDGLINGLAGIAQIATVVLDVLIAVASAVVDNWSWISPIVWGATAALLAYEVATKGAAIATGIATAAKTVAVPIYSLLTGATMAETAAQWGLNAAMYACPIVWIIMLIIMLIALFYAAVAAVNKFAGTSVSATGIICGAFMAALAFIGNIFVALWNLVVDVFVLIYNLVAEVANFIGNVFTDPIGAVCRLFFGLADTVLGILQALASAIDAIFGSNLSGAVQGWRDSLGGWVDDTFGQGEEIMAKLNADDMKLGRFEYGAAWDAGYNFGAGIEDSVSGMFDFSTMDSMGASDAFDLGTTLDGIYGNTGDTAANTAASADALNYAEEDLAYMKDIAEREAINRYTTAEIHVEQHNENHISKDVDVDGIMDMWATDFAEKLDISEEGVHE